MRCILLALVCVFPVRLLANDFCAVTVNIVNHAGQPAAARIRLVDPQGKIVRDFRADGHAELCDFGFGEHTIEIGNPNCQFITLHRIRLIYNVPRYFTVVWDGCMSGIEAMTLPPSCIAYFRVSAMSGRPFGSTGFDEEWFQTRCRRCLRSYFYGDPECGHTEDITISAPGYTPKTLHVACRRYEIIEEGVERRSPITTNCQFQSPRTSASGSATAPRA